MTKRECVTGCNYSFKPAFLYERLYFSYPLIMKRIFSASSMPNPQDRIARIESKLAAYDAGFNALAKNPDDKEWIKAKLHHMYRRDQFLLKCLPKGDPHIFTGATKETFDGVWNLFEQVNQQNVSDLKIILEHITWPVISQYGSKTDSDAWLIVQHADKHLPFQKDVLKILEKLCPQDETDPVHYAYLFDRVAAKEANRSQRYGTQGYILNSRFHILPVEDPDSLDARRKAIGLCPIAEYIRGCEECYGLNKTRQLSPQP